ncbi:MAG: hypothetical protein KA538_01245 [Azonexus sp.]|jgi:hypothetical protein|nr:hypothetical protein [Azonexus sp.]
MLIQDRPPHNPTPSPLRNVALREFVMRQDRIPRDQRVDLPEIQESTRVTFSDAALAASAEGTRNVVQKARPTDERGAAELQLRAYRAIASL